MLNEFNNEFVVEIELRSLLLADTTMIRVCINDNVVVFGCKWIDSFSYYPLASRATRERLDLES